MDGTVLSWKEAKKEAESKKSVSIEDELLFAFRKEVWATIYLDAGQTASWGHFLVIKQA